MKDRILVSIVTYNSAKVITSCIAALAWLRDAAIQAQIVVVDNNSTDNTIEVLERACVAYGLDMVTIVRSETNTGWGGGNNQALRACHGEPDYVLLCNPDAHIDAPNFDALLRALKRHEPKGAIAVPFLDGPYGRVLGANPEWGILKYFLGGYTSGLRAYRRFQARHAVLQGSFEIPRAYASGALALISWPALRDAGFFDESIFMFNDDIDVSRRIIACGHTLIGTGDSVGHHLGGQGARLGKDFTTGTSAASLHYASELVFVEKWYGPRWAHLVALYRWHVFFRANNALRRAFRRQPLQYGPMRAPSGAYLRQRRADRGLPGG